MARPFTLDRLEELYAAMPRDTFWRHDVDVSLDAAIKMAAWETVREYHSTFYLMVTSPFYTMGEAREARDALHGLGHCVGLDWETLQPFPRAWDTRGDGTLPVSFHCPKPHLLWKDFRAFDSAYRPEWQGRYFADSRGRFAHGDPEALVTTGPVQINLHPEWWMEPDWLDRHNITPELYHQFFREPVEALA